jgi:hypothetical protein
MKTRLLLVLLLTAASIAFAQKPVKNEPTLAQQFIAKKQVIADDLELQVKDVQYAAIRGYVRYKIAAWLWQKGPDETMRAEALAVKAVEDLYAKKDEMPSGVRYKLVSDLFTLLDTYASERSAKLKTKHGFGLEEDFFSGFSQLEKKDGDQAVAARLLKALSKPGDVHAMINPLLNSLRIMRSSQFPAVLGAFLEGVESGRVSGNNGMLFLFFVNFNDPQAPTAMRQRYFALIVDRARRAVVRPEADNAVVYEMLVSAINRFGELAPDLLAEAMALKNGLAASESRLAKAKREAEARINESLDKLAATIEEAERADDLVNKSRFYSQAVGIAKNSGKFAIAVDLIDRVVEVDKREFMKGWPDQEYADVARRAFEKSEVEIGLKAMDRVVDPVKRADAGKVAVNYYDGKKDPVAARDMLSTVLRSLAQPPSEDPNRVYRLIGVLTTVQKIDRVSLPQTIMLTARSINELPTPGIDDKPGTKKYNDYVAHLMTLSFGLPSVLSVLLTREKADAADLTDRIQKREVRILADTVMAIDALETARKEAEKKAAAEKKN